MPVTDRYKPKKGDPLREQHVALDKLLQEHDEETAAYSPTDIKIQKSKTARKILAQDREAQCKTVSALMCRLAPLDEGLNDLHRKAKGDPNIHFMRGYARLSAPHTIFTELLRALLKRDLPLSAEQLVQLLQWMSGARGFNSYWYPIAGVIQNLEHYAKSNAVTPKLTKAAQAFCKKLIKEIGEKKTYKQRQRIARALTMIPKETSKRQKASYPKASPAPSIHLDQPAMELAAKLLKQIEKSEERPNYWKFRADAPGVKELLSAPATVQAAAVLQTADRFRHMGERISKSKDGNTWSYWNLWHETDYPGVGVVMSNRLLRRRLPFAETDLCYLTERLSLIRSLTLHSVPIAENVIAAIERHVAAGGSIESLRNNLTSIQQALGCISNAPERKLRNRIQCLLDQGSPSEKTEADTLLRRITLQPGEAWSDVATADLKKMPPTRLALWIDLLEHCQSAAGGSASSAWLKKCRLLAQNVRRAELRKHILKWFPLVNQPRTQPVADYEPEYQPDPNLLIIEPHADMLKGLAWACGLDEDKELARALTALALSGYRKVPMIGPRAVKIGNACVTALGMMPGMEGVYQLAVLKVKVKFGTAQKFIEKAFNAAAERVQIPREDLEEMAVPAYGLTEVGRATETMGEFTAELTVGHSVQIEWIKPDGKRTASVPARIKESHGDDLKELKAAGKDIERMLPAQRERIDSLFLRQKTWPFPVWRERYLDHPLVGVLARRLLWDFTAGKRTITGIWFNGRLVDLDLKAIEAIGPETTVRLWHPIDRSAEEIVAWRSWLDAQQIQQPFKQAHREIYVLTDAERTTRVYSNRYAAHVLRQHQFNALCALRGWKNKLRLMVDDEYPPASINLPSWRLRAEFWIEGIGDDYGTDTNESGVFHYVSTDQVRFYEIDAAQGTAHAGGGGYRLTGDGPVPLDQMPPLVFSEVMRDVDMFVGVASVGNDPTWADGGPQGRYRDYWQGVSFGELSATAKTRKDVLQRLVPKLKIAGQCSFDEKFLVVKGSIRTYKIHLGSGNILMAPNDQYLCIVPKQSDAKTGDVFLPFEGDRTLSVILSKAFLLAEDSRITDSTILSQIRAK